METIFISNFKVYSALAMTFFLIFNEASATDFAYGEAVRLNMLLRVPRVSYSGGTDMMIIKDIDELARFNPVDLHQLFYVPTDPIAGTSPLHRLYHPYYDDFMDSLMSNEGSYTFAGMLGYPWLASTPVPGVQGLMRKTKGADHALLYSDENLAGYSGFEYMGVNGYQRYGKANTQNLSLAAGGVTIQSNRVAGGSLWSWKWNGFEFINVRDYGRQIQSSVQIYEPGIPANNPTEAGSEYSDPDFYLPARSQGSPCLMLENSLTSTSSPMQSSRAVPLEWEPSRFGGGPNTPVIWKDMQLGKDVTLNFKGLGAVARYTTIMTLPSATSEASIEIPSIYLNAALDTVFRYDAVSNELQQLQDLGVTPQGTFPVSGIGGMIVSNANGTLAFGLYGASTEKGGSITARGGFQYMRWAIAEEYSSSYSTTSHSATKINALNVGPKKAGTNTFTTYIMSGTRTQVINYMQRLYQLGVR